MEIEVNGGFLPLVVVFLHRDREMRRKTEGLGNVFFLLALNFLINLCVFLGDFTVKKGGLKKRRLHFHSTVFLKLEVDKWLTAIEGLAL